MVKKTRTALPVLGIDIENPAEWLDPRNTPSCQNMMVNRGIIRKRCGITTMGATASEEIMAGREFERTAVRYNVRVGLTKVQKWNTSTLAWDDIGPYTNSFVVNATNNKINFNIGAGELTATVASATYVMGVTQATAGSLCKAIYDAIHAAEAAGTYTVTWSATTGLMTITRSAGTFQLTWHTGTNGADGTDTHIGTLCGFSDTADQTGALTYSSSTIVYRPLTGTTADCVDTAIPTLSGYKTLVFTNGIDYIRKYTGTGNSADLGGSPPLCKYLIDYKGYLVLVNVTSGGVNYPQRFQWSDTGLIETWTGGNSGSKDLLEEGESFTGVGRFGDYITLHKENAIYLAYLIPTTAIFGTERKNTPGTVCDATIQELPGGGQIYLASDGLRIFNGNSSDLIQSPVVSELRESINSEYVHKCHSVIVKELDEYWCFIPIGSQTTPDTVYKYNYVTGKLHKDTYSSMTCSWLYTAVSALTWEGIATAWDSYTMRWDDTSLSKLSEVVILSSNAGLTYQRDTSVNSDNSVAIDAFWETKDFTADEADRFVRWLGLNVEAKGNTVKIAYSKDSGITWTEVEELTLASDYPADTAPLISYFDDVSTKIRYRFRNNTAGQTFYLKQFCPLFEPREMRF